MAWQFRALRAEDRLAQLEAGPVAGDVDQGTRDAPQEHAGGSLRGYGAAKASQTLEPVSESLALSWRRWWQRARGG
jgi:hypothetical protein